MSNTLFAIDVSGIPPKEKTCISCVSFDLHKSSIFFNRFKKKFKKQFRKKGRYLESYDLTKILEFLDANNVISNSTIYNTNNWQYVLRRVPKHRAYKIEKLCGIIYYLLLQRNSKYRRSYIVHVCSEDFMKIKTVISSCGTIAKMRGMDYDILTGSDSYDKHIKIADYVATATRKLKEEELNHFRYYNLVKAHIPDEFIKKVFEKK